MFNKVLTIFYKRILVDYKYYKILICWWNYIYNCIYINNANFNINNINTNNYVH